MKKGSKLEPFLKCPYDLVNHLNNAGYPLLLVSNIALG